MSVSTSPSTGRRYGIDRVCRVWAVPRSSLYAARTKSPAGESAPSTNKRGPKPEISDQELLEAVRKDLASSPFQGEGHRKVWARLRVCDAIWVSCKRVLRVMREHLLV